MISYFVYLKQIVEKPDLAYKDQRMIFYIIRVYKSKMKLPQMLR